MACFDSDDGPGPDARKAFRTTARCALQQNREVHAVAGNVMNKNSWGPNTADKQCAKLVATREDVWKELLADVRLALTLETGNESPGPQTASLFQEPSLFRTKKDRHGGESR